MKTGIALVVLSLMMVGCASEGSGPASQKDIDDITGTFKAQKGSSPDVPIELRNKGVAPGTTAPAGKTIQKAGK